MSRRTDRTGRSKGEGKHVRHYEWVLASPAYRSLSCYARCLLTELKRLYDGQNNGTLFLSARTAAVVLGLRPSDAKPKDGIGKNIAARAFHELEDRGFIRPRQKGAFEWKARQATCWVLTEYEAFGQLPTKDFMRWKPADEKQNTVPLAGQTVTPAGQGDAETAVFPSNCHASGTDTPSSGRQLSRQRYTYSLPCRGASPGQSGAAAAAQTTSPAQPPPSPPPRSSTPKRPRTRRARPTQIDLEESIAAAIAGEAQP